MIRVSVMYPNTPGAKFDLDYYTNTHIGELVRGKLSSVGLVRAEVDKGVSGAMPGSDAPFVAVGHLYFNSIADFLQAFGPHAGEIMGDMPNFTDLQPQIQISEVVSE
ncbi:MAG: EthD family reductase [Dehalococcoidia bacterium]